MIFDYFEYSAVATTVCDLEGTVIYQNQRAIEALGDTRGQNLRDCHKPESWAKITAMLREGTTNAYTIEKGTTKKLIYQTPWYDVEGNVAGLIEYSTVLPEDMPHFVRPVANPEE